MDSRVAQLSKSKKSIVGLFKILQWVFFAIFAVYCLCGGAIAFYSVFPPSGFEYVGPDSFLYIVPIVLSAIAGGMAILILGIISRKIGKGSSPFTFQIATLLNILAGILLLSFLATLLIHPGTQVGAVDDTNASAMTFEYDGNPNSDATFDMKTFIACIACFAMAAVFRYGAILQNEADDLV